MLIKATPPAGSAAGSDPNAIPAAKSFIAQSMPDTVSFSGDMTVLMFPADDAALAIGLVGDAYPRWLLTTDAGDGLYMGDGTFDPYSSSGVNIWLNSDHDLVLYSPNLIRLNGALGVLVIAGDIEVLAGGVILRSPDNTRHRIKVANDGTLSTEVVA